MRTRRKKERMIMKREEEIRFQMFSKLLKELNLYDEK